MWNTESIPRLSGEQRQIKEAVQDVCSRFGNEYWREKDRNREFPLEFVNELGAEGWLGVGVPEEYGGKELSIIETGVILEEIAASGAGMNGSIACHVPMLEARSLLPHCQESVKERVYPELAAGEKLLLGFGVAEQHAGYEITATETSAERDGETFVVNGEKTWLSRFETADYMILLARTTPKSEVDRPTKGLTLFLVDVNDAKSQGATSAELIESNVLAANPPYDVTFTDLEVPAENVIGDVGGGFYRLFDEFNQERLMYGAESLGMARAALGRAIDYAGDREVFDRPIGKNQAIQHPIADAYARLVSARTTTYHTMQEFQAGEDVEEMANVVNYVSQHAAMNAIDVAFETHGGWGAAVEFDVERWWREAQMLRSAPISKQMVLNYLGAHVLGLPRSY